MTGPNCSRLCRSQIAVHGHSFHLSECFLRPEPNEPLESHSIWWFRFLFLSVCSSSSRLRGGKKSFRLQRPVSPIRMPFLSFTAFGYRISPIKWCHVDTPARNISLPANWKMCAPLQCRPHLNRCHSNQFALLIQEAYSCKEQNDWNITAILDYDLFSSLELTQEGSGSRNDRSFSNGPFELEFNCSPTSRSVHIIR